MRACAGIGRRSPRPAPHRERRLWENNGAGGAGHPALSAQFQPSASVPRRQFLIARLQASSGVPRASPPPAVVPHFLASGSQCEPTFNSPALPRASFGNTSDTGEKRWNSPSSTSNRRLGKPAFFAGKKRLQDRSHTTENVIDYIGFVKLSFSRIAEKLGNSLRTQWQPAIQAPQRCSLSPAISVPSDFLVQSLRPFVR
jgi:hypothetical protein